MPNGLLLIDKPIGLRSTECVARIKRFFGRNVRVGHAGTLDSTASGLLIVLLGAATRLSDYVMKLPKTYEAIVKLGVATDTGDASGQIVFRGDAAKVNAALFDRALCSFWGMRMQRPPEISALKIAGKASHRAARAGEEVEHMPRPVLMTSVRRFLPLANGETGICIRCGKGTYVRSIVRDIGNLLGCGAHVVELRRLSTGPFRVQDACLPEELGSRYENSLCSMRRIGDLFHRVALTDDAERRLGNGLCTRLSAAGSYIAGTIPLESGLYVEGKSMIGFADIIYGGQDGDEKEPAGDVAYLRPRANIFDGNGPPAAEERA